MPPDPWDTIIVGGGPAGLSAALVLGRCRRKVLLFDDGQPRNQVSHAVHGFLSRDGIPPAELRAISHEQLARYACVVVDRSRVVDAARSGNGFMVHTGDGRGFRCRKLLLAPGPGPRPPAAFPPIRDHRARSHPPVSTTGSPASGTRAATV